MLEVGWEWPSAELSAPLAFGVVKEDERESLAPSVAEVGAGSRGDKETDVETEHAYDASAGAMGSQPASR